MRNKAEKRFNDFLHERKKVYIIRHVYNDDGWYHTSFEGKEHKLSKGKVHCSCPMCAFHGTTIQDARNLMKLLDFDESYEDDEDEIRIPVRHFNRMDKMVKGSVNW